MAKGNKNVEGVTPLATEKQAEKKTAKNSKPWYKSGWVSAIIGVWLLMAVASIVYSSATIILGTEGIAPLILIAPQISLAIVIAIWKFIKF